ncbi:hypothetical protein [Geotalea uraniireducens]|uniref:hypothetical protein n=1 Tax=Geotalea uraniireducens TaxID=351604 RepID=UPI002490467D|nr:hypothetical protein [Geotalea uraniireducens]
MGISFLGLFGETLPQGRGFFNGLRPGSELSLAVAVKFAILLINDSATAFGENSWTPKNDSLKSG